MYRISHYLFSCLALFIVSTAIAQPPAPIVIHKDPLEKSSTPSSENPFTITVKEGDTVYSIAKANDVARRELIDNNNLKPPYILTPGQTLRLPKARFHIVKNKDTLYSISRSYDVDITQLIRTNNLTEPYTIYAGQKLRLPATTSQESATPAPTPPTPVEATPAQTTPQSPPTEKTIHTSPAIQEASNTPTPILKKQTEALPSEAPLTPSSNIIASTEAPTLPIPRLKSSITQAKSAPPATTSSSTTPTTNAPATIVENTAPTNTTPRYKPFSSSSSSKAPVSAANSHMPQFMWPVRGEIVSGFGAKEGGLYNDGINIGATEGTAVKAAENGTVVYVGNELRGYGNLILLKHASGYLTAYAHNQTNLVKKGTAVNKGQTIAYLGSTGHVDEPQLHFSIRKGRKALDPRKFLPRNFSQLGQ